MDFGLKPDRIGVMGFSAGGHVAATAATLFDAAEGRTGSPLDGISARPDFAALIYPVITMREKTHGGSKKQLLGDNPSPELVALLSNEEHVTKDTPPTFLVHTFTDTTVPVENSMMFAEALRRAGVPFEFHLYERGAHGFGLGTKDPILATWPARCADWLRLHGFTTPKASAKKP